MFFPKESASIEIDWPVKASCFTSVLSPQDILSSSSGEVILPETVDFDKNGDPVHRGLFCENIFGRKETYRCSCSWFGIALMQETPINKKNIHQFKKHSGSTCQVCGAPITPLKDRLARFGHIKLAAPVTHIWFLKSQPNKIGAVLDLTLEQLEKIIYFEQYAVIESSVESIPAGTLLTEEKYRLQRDAFPDQFKVEIGAEAIRELLARQDMIALSLKLRDDLARTRSKTKMQKLQERLFVIESLRDSGNPPERMVLEIIPVLPPDLRPLIPLEGDKFANSDLNDLYRRVINRNNRLKRLLELDAPDIIIRNEKRMLQEAVDVLFDNGSRGRVITGFNKRRLTSISDSLLIPINLTSRFRDYSYLKNSFQAFLYASHKVNQPELIDVFLAFCRGLCLSFDFSIAEEVKSIKLTTDSKTQYLLGQLFRSGVSVSEDLEEALKWYTKAAEQGDAKAQYFIGIMYHLGHGVIQDLEKAAGFYLKAAEQGMAEAQYFIGQLYYFGQGVIQDLEKAADFYLKAAEQGMADAQAFLGFMYDVGRGIPQDKKEAVVWYTKASEQGNAKAQFRLGLLYDEKKNHKKAFELYTEAAEQEHAAAQNNLGVMYESGRGVKSDDTEAIKWYTKAAEQGDAKAQDNLVRTYLS
jgi:TPR repeat protein